MSALILEPTIEDHRVEVRLTLQRLSAAWQDRRYQELATLFDERIVMVLPGPSARIEGRPAVVDSYMDTCVSIKSERKDSCARQRRCWMLVPIRAPGFGRKGSIRNSRLLSTEPPESLITLR